MQLTVAVIGAPHGLKGEVRLDVRTDQPERRLAAGATLETDPPEEGPLTIVRTRRHKGATYVLFDECTDRTMAERLRGVKLTVETDEDEFYEEDAFYEHELRGLEVLDPQGYELGEVVGLERGAAQDLVLVRETGGQLVRVPFVRQIVTEVDLDDGCIVVDPPGGLFPDDENVDDDAAEDEAAAGGEGAGSAAEGEAAEGEAAAGVTSGAADEVADGEAIDDSSADGGASGVAADGSDATQAGIPESAQVSIPESTRANVSQRAQVGSSQEVGR